MSKFYNVWWPDRGQDLDDSQKVKAFDAEDAASKWADWYDYHSNDYSIVGGEAAEVMVLEEGCVAPVAVTVFGEMTRSYRAREGGHVKA